MAQYEIDGYRMQVDFQRISNITIILPAHSGGIHLACWWAGLSWVGGGGRLCGNLAVPGYVARHFESEIRCGLVARGM
jgi:hypothetical protein